MNKKLYTGFILVVALLFCMPLGIHAEGKYKTITASVPVSFIAPDRGDNACITYMETVNNSPEPVVNPVGFIGSGSDEFNINIGEPGTYRYTVYQKSGTDSNVIYDDTVYSVIVYVTADTGDTLKYAVTATASNTGKKPDSIDFQNVLKNSGGGSGGGGGAGGSGTSGGGEGGGSSSGGRKRGGSSSSIAGGKRGGSTTEGTTTDSDSSDVTKPDDNSSSNNGSETTTETTIEGTTSSTDVTQPNNRSDFTPSSNDNDTNNNGSGSTSDEPSHITDSEITAQTVVNTGDTNDQGLWLIIMGASAGVILLSYIMELIEKRKLKSVTK